MLLSDNSRVVSALCLQAGVFVAGIACGFAVPGVSCAWTWLAAATFWAALAVYGWRLPVPRAVFVFLAGTVLAMRVEKSMTDVMLHSYRRPPGGGAPVWRLVVEGGVGMRPAKEKGMRWVQFMSHAGPLPVKTVFPLKFGEAMPMPGEVWECAGWLSIPKKTRGRYRRAAIWVGKKGVARRVAPPGWRMWRGVVRDVSRDMSRRMSLGLKWCPEVAALNKAMLLGKRADVSAARRESFVVSGTIHVFAISGLHVMLIAHLIERLLASMGVSVRLRSAAVIIPVVLYVILTGARPSAVRAALMAGFYYSAAVFGRRPDSLSAWSLAVFTVYGLQPELFFDAGCTLSFTVMLGIVVFLKWTGAFSPPHAVLVFMKSRAGTWLVRRFGWLFDGYHVSLAAWAAGTPVTARLFGVFTWGGLVANIVAVKLAALAVVFGFTGVVLSYVSGRAAAICNLVAALLTRCLLAIADIVAKLPDASLRVRTWSILDCAAWYGGFVLLLLVLERILPRRNDLSGEWWR